MNTALRMDLSDCGSPEALIGVALKHHPEWQPPVPIEDFAREVGIVEIRTVGSDSFEGALITDDEKNSGIIVVRAGRRKERQRFTVGHELGHFLIPTHRGNQECTAADLRENRRATIRQRQETEANRFSAGMLMPKPWFVRDMRRMGDADVEHVQSLAATYVVSLEATVNRYAELSDDACAFVFSKDGIVRYVRKNNAFPWVAAKKDQPLPSECATQRYRGELHKPSNWVEVDGSVWLEAERGRRSPVVLEQSLLQSDGFSITLLFISPDQLASDGDEEEDSDRDQAPRFPR